MRATSSISATIEAYWSESLEASCIIRKTPTQAKPASTGSRSAAALPIPFKSLQDFQDAVQLILDVDSFAAYNGLPPSAEKSAPFLIGHCNFLVGETMTSATFCSCFLHPVQDILEGRIIVLQTLSG